MRGSTEFAAYVEATGELQVVDLHPLTRSERTAFFINVYNAMVAGAYTRSHSCST